LMIDEFGLTGAVVLVMVRIASGKKLSFIVILYGR